MGSEDKKVEQYKLQHWVVEFQRHMHQGTEQEVFGTEHDARAYAHHVKSLGCEWVEVYKEGEEWQR